jgi:hypothetical protein
VLRGDDDERVRNLRGTIRLAARSASAAESRRAASGAVCSANSSLPVC